MRVTSIAFWPLAIPFVLAAQNNSTHVSFVNKHRFYFEVDGNAIDSVNGKVDWIYNQYFWISEPQWYGVGAKNCDIISYSSNDLKNWHLNGPLFNISDPVNSAACAGFGSCSRPKVVYNEKTNKYVFYRSSGRIGDPGISVFTSSFLTHGYKYAGRMLTDYNYYGYGIEDLGLTVIDGIGYVIWTGFNLSFALQFGTPDSIRPPFFQTVLIQQLTDDFLNGTGKSHPVIQAGGDFPVTQNSLNLLDGQIESPDLFKRGQYFYMVGSVTCAFCNGTLTVAYRSMSPFGPWTRQIVDTSDTCGGQVMGVMTVPPVNGKENSYVLQADEFHTAPTGMSFTAAKGHSFWTLHFNADASIKKIDCSPDATYSLRAPLGINAPNNTGRAISATDGSGNNGDYWAESGIPAAFFYQTWTSSKTGNLIEVGVNLAANSPNQNLTITVFRYHSIFFVWETLGLATIGLVVPVATSFLVQRVPVGISVQKGDRLGFALTVGAPIPAPNTLPFAYLMQDTSNLQTDHVLYALHRGKVSFDGLNGLTSPLYTLQDRELKWYATVQ